MRLETPTQPRKRERGDKMQSVKEGKGAGKGERERGRVRRNVNLSSAQNSKALLSPACGVGWGFRAASGEPTQRLLNAVSSAPCKGEAGREGKRRVEKVLRGKAMRRFPHQFELHPVAPSKFQRRQSHQVLKCRHSSVGRAGVSSRVRRALRAPSPMQWAGPEEQLPR